MLTIKDKLAAIESELNQLAEAVRITEDAASKKTLTPAKRVGIQEELESLKDAILDVEAQLNRKTCYAS